MTSEQSKMEDDVDDREKWRIDSAKTYCDMKLLDQNPNF